MDLDGVMVNFVAVISQGVVEVEFRSRLVCQNAIISRNE